MQATDRADEGMASQQELGRTIAYTVFNSNGRIVEDAAEQVTEKLRHVNKAQIAIAVVGSDVGVGKSSLVNALLGFAPDDIGAAPVGGMRSDDDIKRYQHPSNPKLAVYDVPGFGTSRFQKATYIRDIDAERFDLFLVVSATRFTENDTWLVREIRRHGKELFFVRTKIDADVSNDKQARPKTHDETKVIDSIRQTTEAGLEAAGFSQAEVPVFLVDSYETSKYDFKKLQERIDQQPFIKAFKTHSAQIFRKRIRELSVACFSLLMSLVAFVPFLPICIYPESMKKKIEWIDSQLGIDDAALQRYLEISGSTELNLFHLSAAAVHGVNEETEKRVRKISSGIYILWMLFFIISSFIGLFWTYSILEDHKRRAEIAAQRVIDVSAQRLIHQLSS